MNKNTVKVSSLVAGILTAIVAVFYFVVTIQSLFSFSDDVKSNIYLVIFILEVAIVCALLGLFSFLIIKKFIKNNDDSSYMLAPAMVLFAYGVLGTFIGMCFWGFGSANSWISLIFNAIALALIIVAKFAQLDKMISGIFILIALGIGFIFSIVNLTNTGGIYIAIYIFEMFMFAAYFVYYLFNMLVEGTFKKSE